MGSYEDYRAEMFPDEKKAAARAKERAEEERKARERQAEFAKLSPEEREKIPIDLIDVSPQGALSSEFGRRLFGHKE